MFFFGLMLGFVFCNHIFEIRIFIVNMYNLQYQYCFWDVLFFSMDYLHYGMQYLHFWMNFILEWINCIIIYSMDCFMD